MLVLLLHCRLGTYIGAVDQKIDRTISFGTYDIQVTVEFSNLSTPYGLSFNSIQLVCSNDNDKVSNYYHYSSYNYSDKTDSSNAHFVITYKDVVINSDFNKFSYLFDFNTVSATAEGTCDIGLKFIKVLMIDNRDESVEIQKENLKVSKNIFETVKNIFSSIVNLPSNIANSVKGFFDNVVNAVVNLGNFIVEGIKGLFIPSEQDITNMKEKWSNLLSERFRCSL